MNFKKTSIHCYFLAVYEYFSFYIFLFSKFEKTATNFHYLYSENEV